MIIILIILIIFILYFLFKNDVTLIAKIINPVIASCSLIGNEVMYNTDTLETSKELIKFWKVFRKEALETYENYSTIKGDMFFEDIVKTDKEWKKLYIKWHSDIDPVARKLCPETCKIIEIFPDIKIAMFSVLAPGAKILPHKGVYKGCLRFHLGLSTPNSDDCFIIINEEKYSWKDGEGILLDDTYEHEVHNNTEETRIILFCDIVRPLNFIGSSINNTIMNLFSIFTRRKNI